LNQVNASLSDHDSTRYDESEIESEEIERGTVGDTSATRNASSFKDKELSLGTIVGTYEATISIQKEIGEGRNTSG
jgi:hypothetical protein